VIYLLERQVGFGDNEGIGFPSIKGCLAVAYQTTSGIFGFHNAGNSAADKFALRSKKWRDWVFQHPNGRDAGVALYGVSFIRRNLRGYSATKSPVAFWKDELKTFAHQLNFTGPIFGSDLAGIFTEAREVSALVEFRKEGAARDRPGGDAARLALGADASGRRSFFNGPQEEGQHAYTGGCRDLTIFTWP
jgi:hypothetical protein